MKRFEDEIHGDPPGAHEVAEFFLRNGNGKSNGNNKNKIPKKPSISKGLLGLSPRETSGGPWEATYCEKDRNFVVARSGGNKKTIQTVPSCKEIDVAVATYKMLVQNGLSNGYGVSESPVFFQPDLLGKESALRLAEQLNKKDDRLI